MPHQLAVHLYSQLKMDTGHPKHVLQSFYLKVISCLLLVRKHKSNMADGYFVFKFPRRSVDGKHFMRFQSETSNFKFPARELN